MPAGPDKTTMTIGNGVVGTQAQLLQHIGAIHNHLSIHEHHLHRVEMYHELLYLHAIAVQERNKQSRKTATQEFPVGNGNDNNQHPSQVEKIRQFVPEHNGHHHTIPPAVGKLALRRWHAEGAYEQPWNTLPYGKSAAGHEDRTVLDRPKI
jgi:hypothetical protein